MEEIDRTEWDKAWKAAPNRRLLSPATIDWNTLVNHDVGEVIDVTFVEAPRKFRGVVYIAVSTCAVCGQSAADELERIEIVLSPRFTNFPSVGFGAFAHKVCAERCPEIDDRNPIPW